MAVTTTNEDIGTVWGELSAGNLDVMVQLLSVGSIEIYVGATAPADDTNTYGAVLSSSGQDVFSVTGLAAADNVYARSLTGEAENVCVMVNPQAA